MSLKLGRLVRVFEHNGIEVALVEQENCCGMPRLNWAICSGCGFEGQDCPPCCHDRRGLRYRRAVPSCVLMFKAGLP